MSSVQEVNSLGAHPLRAGIVKDAPVTLSDYLFSAVLCGFIALLFITLDDKVIHWYLLPAFLCGTASGVYIIMLIRKKIDFFDPIFFFATMFFYNYFFSPILAVYLDWEQPDTFYYDDPRKWTGYLLILSFFGFLLFGFALSFAQKRTSPITTFFSFDRRRGKVIFAIALAASFMAYILYMARFGGLFALMEAKARFELGEMIYGTGPITMISEAFPILLTSYLIVNLPKKSHGFGVYLLILTILLILQMLFSGFRGSRTDIILHLLWVAGIIHLYKSKLRLLHWGILFAFVLIFAQIYSFYKMLGSDVIYEYQEGATYEDFKKKSRREEAGVFLGDLSRIGLQPFILQQVEGGAPNYELSMGRTYLTAFLIVIPRAIWRDRPVGPNYNLYLISNPGEYVSQEYTSSQVVGLAGEGMLNFGWVGAIIPYFFVGLIVGWFRKKYLTMKEGDLRIFLIPYFSINFGMFVTGILEFFLFSIFKNTALLTLAILFSSNIVRNKKSA
ncbi:MAG: hypothetical protein Kow0090_05610 [Myxococcota bacterium]